MRRAICNSRPWKRRRARTDGRKSTVDPITWALITDHPAACLTESCLHTSPIISVLCLARQEDLVEKLFVLESLGNYFQSSQDCIEARV